jgi:glycosyltransferase EpsD
VYKFLTPFLDEMQNKGWTIGVAARDDRTTVSGKHMDLEKEIYYHALTFGTKQWQLPNFFSVFQLIKLIKKNHYQIVHCHTAVAAAMTRIAAGMMGNDKPIIIYTTHGFHFFRGASFLRWLLYYPLEYYLSKYTDILITINQEDYHLAKHFRLKDIRLLPGVGVDLSRFYPDQSIRKRIQ